MMRAWSATLLLVLLLAAPALAQGPTGASVPSKPDAEPGATSPSAVQQGQAAPAPSPATPLPPALAPAISLTLAPANGINVGDVLKLRLDVLVPKGVDVAVPEQSLAPFEALDRRARSEPSGDKQRFVFELDLLALEAGTVTLPALRVRVVGPKGELGETRTSPRTVQVKSPLANEPNAQPKPPTKPVSVIADDYTLAWALGSLLAIAIVAIATLLISRWLSRRPKAAAPLPPPRPAWEVALEKLEQLDRRKDALLAADRGAEFVDGVSNVLREYLGRRYGFDGLESTSDEIQRTLERLRPHKLSLSGVSLLLEQCDLVKFARATPDAEQCDDLWNGAVGLVRATTVASQVEPQPAAQAGEAAR